MQRSPGAVTVSVSYLPEVLAPTQVWNYQKFLPIQATFDTLVRVDIGGQIVSALADKWIGDSDGQVYRLELNDCSWSKSH